MTQFTREFVELARKKDLEKISEAFDDEALWAIASEGLLVSTEMEKALSSRYHQLTERPGGLGAAWTRPEVVLDFVGVAPFQGETFPVLRVESRGITDYHFLDLQADAEKNLRIVKTYSTTSGEWSTVSNRRILLAQFVAMQGNLNKLSSVDRLDVENLMIMDDFGNACSGKDPEKISEVYSQLPDGLRKQNWVRKVYLQSIYRNEKLYLEAVKRMETEEPDDPGIALLTMIPALKAGQWDSVSNKVELIDQFVGGDPFLNYFRATVANERGQVDAALGFIRKAALTLPKHRQINLVYLSLLNRTQNFDEMAKLMISMGANIGIGIPKKTLLESPVYREFSESPAGKGLIEKLP